MSGRDQLELGLAEPQPAQAAPPVADAGEPALPDAAERARIVADLDTNLLVEAGAGSGKTTALVQRMSALVRSGAARIDEIAAVTFTRKAAAELRERFQSALETDLASARTAADADAVARLDLALRDIDRAFLGTIHAFCARLLRERPLEAELDPAFHELQPVEETRLARHFWNVWLERLVADEDAALGALADVGLRPAQLFELYREISDNPDVVYPIADAPRPEPTEVAAVRARLERLLDDAQRIMPRDEPDDGWDALQTRIRTLRFSRWVIGWDSELAFLDALAEVSETTEPKVSAKAWSDVAAAKAWSQTVQEFARAGGPARQLLEQWFAHRYPIAVGFAARAAEAFALERRRTARLTFQDLLMLAATLLRSRPDACAELGRRYRRLLVDEFQDTDPVQAEILFRLAADPAEGARATTTKVSWLELVPRPGALFVVGDPKQSIYRFRRADIAVYNAVRDRFADFGAVLLLTTNFRSRAPIGTIVNDTFDHPERLPRAASEQQAAFAPLVPRPGPEPARREGVFSYVIAGAANRRAEMAEDDALRLAAWIASRVQAGERDAGDFLVLTRTKHHVDRYARALEAHGLPAEITGAGVGVEDELHELIELLGALVDPENPVRIVAALVGLFFGLDHEQLLEHVLRRREAGAGGNPFSLSTPIAERDDMGPVERALLQLQRWRELARHAPADIVIGRIVDEIGLLPYAAAGELGATRAGALVFALDAVRQAALDGDTSLARALDALLAALESNEAEAPLEPGRSDVVRVMNLHQAKGLEAPVVVLARPFPAGVPDPVACVARQPGGDAMGWLLVHERQGWNTRVLARPRDWDEHVAREARFRDAEEVRLLYVAATRAADELVIATHPRKKDSPWRLLDDWAQRHGTPLDTIAEQPPQRERLERSAAELMAQADALAAERLVRMQPSYRLVAVTALAKGDAVADATPDAGIVTVSHSALPVVKGGRDWGSAVHGTLEAAARGATGERLRRIAAALLVENERTDEHGEPLDLAELLAHAEAVIGSELWRRAAHASERHVEVPIAAPGIGPQGETVEGIIDLVFREPDGWVIVDYKTDATAAPGFAARVSSYRAQVEWYAAAWQHLTSESVKQKLLYLVREGRSIEA